MAFVWVNPLKSRFHLFEASFRARRPPQIRALEMPARSDVLSELGSGASVFHDYFRAWSQSDAGGTSRAVFSALADAIRSGRDRRTGGAPQLVGLYRKGSARPIGVVWEGRRWLFGMEVRDEGSLINVTWHNALFEIADPVALARHERAQLQPRPRNAGEDT